MPILNQEIHKRVLSALDAEGSERYLWDQDTKIALKGAIEVLITWFNQAFADNKLSPESLRELVLVKVWQTNFFSRVSFDAQIVGHPLWSILAVYPEIKTTSSVSSSPPASKSESKFRPDVTFVSSVKSAKRLTMEEWNQNVDNAFMPGNDLLSGGLKEYAYLDFADYTSTSYTKGNDKQEITIRPDVPNKLVAISYLKYPSMPDDINGSIEFPQSLTDLLTEIVLNKITYKQGQGGANLYAVTSQNINRLVNSIK